LEQTATAAARTRADDPPRIRAMRVCRRRRQDARAPRRAGPPSHGHGAPVWLLRAWTSHGERAAALLRDEMRAEVRGRLASW